MCLINLEYTGILSPFENFFPFLYNAKFIQYMYNKYVNIYIYCVCMYVCMHASVYKYMHFCIVYIELVN